MSSLMNIVPQKAILADTGEEVNANHMEVNTRVAVKAGTMIPIDGVVVEGNCEVGEQALTGESFPSFIKGHVGANHSSNAGVGREGVCIRLNRVAMSYRSRFAVVPQMPFLFKGSIRDNLDPLNLNDDLKIWKALEKSNVDTQTAAKLKDAISSECKGLTVITIAHRISTILHMDNVLVLEQGVLIEFQNVTLRYMPSLPHALCGLSLTIVGGTQELSEGQEQSILMDDTKHDMYKQNNMIDAIDLIPAEPFCLILPKGSAS
ncbi:ABC transporter C family member 13 [Tanacetum coccineum]|uniref:ABC transporter C family member 13 n=1 Tax=Tanacetum coccineum TaxID=301880 RepID=A0ABQ5BYD2_9ASTR